jgi:Family of unknown function (DUF5686)/CarboxypepD_reg-like domain
LFDRSVNNHFLNKPAGKFLLIACLLLPVFGLAQTVVSGKVTDAASGDPIPFANVIFKGISVGITTDFDGNYTLKTSTPSDSLQASYIGYKAKTKFVKKGVAQVINFQLQELSTSLSEVVITAGENPAFEILRRVDQNRKEHDKRRLTAYEYEAYTKIEIDIDNMSEKFRKRKILQKITQVLDSVDRIAGEDGKPILPLFISENVSKLYYRDNPRLKTEKILKSKITGIGIEDGDMVTQLVGSSFQEYNFYQHWLNIVGKDFISPIADGGRLYYDYDLVDSVYINGFYCYRIDFTPKSPQDLAFTGTMWITKHEYALKQIDATVAKEANLNFIEKIKIQQELDPTGDEAWLPVKNRVLIDVSELTKNTAGMLAKFYTSNKNIIINKPRDNSFYAQDIVLSKHAYDNKDEEHWDSLRHEPLSATEKSVYRMIDTLQNIPIVKTYTDVIMLLVNGYYEVGKIEIGPIMSLASINNIEGFRFQPGFRTTEHFSKKWMLGMGLGYGFKDEKIKYNFNVTRIISRKRYTSLSFRTRKDLNRIGVDDEALADNYIFLAAQRFGTFRRGYYFDEHRLNFQREFFKGFQQRVAIRYNTFSPAFNFGYYPNPEDHTVVDQGFETSEILLETRFARDELFVQGQNVRYSLGVTYWPIITFTYTHGVKGLLGSDFNYNKTKLSIDQPIRWGVLGTARAKVTGEYIFEALPYPLLAYHLGNETAFYTTATYNLMNFGEFVSDSYASFQYQHNFEGLLLNRIPLMRKLKWRLVGSANVLYGGLSKKNRALLLENDMFPDGTEAPSVGFLERGKPYVEVGYGVANIFRFFRVDFMHRLTYLDYNPDVKTRSFGVLFSAHLDL